MKADFTNWNPEAVEVFERIAGNATPAIAIYSARSANEPIVLYGLISASELCEALGNATH